MDERALIVGISSGRCADSWKGFELRGAAGGGEIRPINGYDKETRSRRLTVVVPVEFGRIIKHRIEI